MSVSIKNSQFAKDGIHVTYSDNSTQNITFNNKLLTLDKALSVVGSTNLSGGLTSTANTSLNTLNISGDTVSNGNLNVAGVTTLTNNLNVNGETALNNNLSVSGQSILSGATSVGGVLNVSGVSNLYNKLNVADDVKMDNQLTVVGSSHFSTLNTSGDTSVGGGLNVVGISNLGNNLNVSGDAVLSQKLTVNNDATLAQAANVGGVLTVEGAANLHSSLNVTSVATLSNNLSVAGTSNLAVLNVSENANLAKTLDVTGVTSLGNNLNVTGVSNLNNNLNVSGVANLNNALNVTGLSTLSGNAVVAGGLTVAADGNTSSSFGGDVSMNKNLSVSGNVNVTGQLTFGSVVSTSSEVQNGLIVNGTSLLKGALTANSNATFNQNVTVGGNLTVLGQTTSVQTNSLEVKDAAILIADGNQSDLIDTGFDIQYKPSGASASLYSGLKRRAGTGEFVLFKDSANKIDAAAAVSPYNNYMGEYFQYDLGSSKSVSSYGISPYSNTGTLKSWALVASNDNTTWNQVDFKENQAVVWNDTWQHVNLSSPSPFYRYWRFIILKHQIGYYSEFGLNVFMKDENGVAIQSVSASGSAYFTAPHIALISSLASNERLSGTPGMYGQEVYGAINIPVSNHFYANGVYSGQVSTTVVTQVVENYAVLIADSFNCASDMNLKKNVVPLDGALDKIDHIRGVYHDWIDEKNDEHAIGVIAQEVQAVYPELVRHGADGYLSVNYPKLTAVLLQALKELKALVLSKQ